MLDDSLGLGLFTIIQSVGNGKQYGTINKVGRIKYLLSYLKSCSVLLLNTILMLNLLNRSVMCVCLWPHWLIFCRISQGDCQVILSSFNRPTENHSDSRLFRVPLRSCMWKKKCLELKLTSKWLLKKKLSVEESCSLQGECWQVKCCIWLQRLNQNGHA